MTSAIKCNKCWQTLQQDNAYITSCSHLFCESCARQMFSKEYVCGVCDTMLNHKGGIFPANLNPTPEKSIPLYGLSPVEIDKIASRAHAFYLYQIETESQHMENKMIKLQTRAQQGEKYFTEKLEESYQKITALQRQLEVSLPELENLRSENAEYKFKVEELIRQKKKLQDLYEGLKQNPNGGNLFSETPNMHQTPLGSPYRIPPYASPNPEEDTARFNNSKLNHSNHSQYSPYGHSSKSPYKSKGNTSVARNLFSSSNTMEVPHSESRIPTYQKTPISVVPFTTPQPSFGRLNSFLPKTPTPVLQPRKIIRNSLRFN